ncbi:MAG: hypothetical protein HFJ46_00365 [Clostridia bacterium]|jgi:uncharacterized membrane protein YdbT with pleckstrin-like domain|nr:hypothetical protein [Clostridia bacterium]
MKCKRCGAKLNKEGDICKNCYKKILEEEELEKDVNELLKLKRKYIPAYEVYNLADVIIVFCLVIISFLAMQAFLNAFLSLFILVVVIAILLLIKKRLAVATRCVFYEKKIKYNFDFLFIHNEKVIKYDDIKDISYYQTRRQKKYDLADLYVYVKYTGLIGGMSLKNMPNAIKNLEKIKSIVFKPEEESEE